MRSSRGEDAGVNRLAGEGHRQRLVRAVGVVFGPPGIQRCLQRLDARKRAVHIQQLTLQGLVQPLDLARGGR
jgi:hypothetical protein